MPRRSMILALVAVLGMGGVAGMLFLSSRGGPSRTGDSATATPAPPMPASTPQAGTVTDGERVLRGEVADSGGVLLERVEVNAFDPDGRTYLAATDGLGQFEIPVESGEWHRVSFRKNGYAKRTGVPVRPGDAARRYLLQLESELAATAVDPASRIPEYVSFAGRVVRYQDQERLAEVLVQVIDGAENTHEAVSGASGEFLLRDLRPGSLLCGADFDHHRLLYPRVPIEVSGPVRDIVFEMAATGIVSGLVVDSASRPVAGARVAVQYLTADGAQLDGLAEPIPTDAEGRFAEMTAAVQRRFQIEARLTGGETPAAGGFGRSDARVLANPGDRDRVVIVLDQNPDPAWSSEESRALQVLDTDGAPRLDAVVRVEPSGGHSVDSRRGGDGLYAIPLPAGQPVTVKADTADRSGVALAGVDAGTEVLTLTLLPGGRLRVRVEDAEGQPVTNYRLQATFTQPGDDGAVPMVHHPGVDRWTPVNAPDGVMVYDGLDGGIYRIEATHPRTADGVAEHILVRPGEETAITLTLIEGAVLAGRVVDGNSGDPVPGAEVRISARSAFAMLLEGSAGAVQTIYADGNGAFRVENLNHGTYDLAAAHPEYGTGKRSGFRVPEDGEAVLVVGRGGALEGIVYDTRGERAEGAVLSLVLGRDLGGSLICVTDTAGQYGFSFIPAGVHTVTCTPPGTEATLLKTAEILDGQTTLLDFGAPGARLHGVVTSGGTPVGGATLRIRSDGNIGRSIGSSVAATTADDGSYEFPTAFPAGTWILTAMTGQQTVWYERLSVPSRVDDLRHDIALPANRVSGRVVSAPSGAGVAGANVILEADARMVETAKVASLSGYWTALTFARSGEDGAFDFAGIPLGAVRVRATAEGHAPGQTPPIILTAETVREGVMVLLQPESGITGFVLNEAGTGIAGAAVAALARDGAGSWTAIARAVTGANGAYALQGLGEGEVAVAAVAPGHAVTIVHRVDVPAAGAVVADLTLASAHGGIALTVELPDESPVSDARVDVVRGSGVLPWATHGGTFLTTSGWTGRDGRLILDHLPAGDCIVRVRGPGLHESESVLTVRDGQRTSETIEVALGSDL